MFIVVVTRGEAVRGEGLASMMGRCGALCLEGTLEDAETEDDEEIKAEGATVAKGCEGWKEPWFESRFAKGIGRVLASRGGTYRA